MRTEEKDQIRLLSGHYPFGIHRLIADEAIYFTLLRDPVERAISLFFYYQSLESPWAKRYQTMTFEEYIHLNEFTNWQTALLSSDFLNPSVSQAIKNLQTHFRVVGLTEYFNETLFLLKKAFGWKNLAYTEDNVTPKRPQKEEISAHLIEKIKEANSLDMELYAFVKAQFEQKLQTIHPYELQDFNQTLVIQ